MSRVVHGLMNAKPHRREISKPPFFKKIAFGSWKHLSIRPRRETILPQQIDEIQYDL